MSLEGYLDDQYNQDLQDVAEIEHRVCHLEMSLSSGSGGGRARSPRRRAAPDRRR